MKLGKKRWLLEKAGVLCFCLLVVCPGWGFELKWGTAPAGGLWPTLGAGMLESVKERNPDITGTALPGPGGHNFLGIQSGRFNIAFATTDASAFVWEGKEVYEGKPYRRFRNVACFFPHVSQYLVWEDSGIKSVPDLAGKKVTYGVRGSGSELNVRKVLELYGILEKVRFEYLSFSDAANRMKDRQIDGFLLNTPLPYSVFMDLANTRPIRLLNFSEDKIAALLAWNPGLERYVVSPGIYKGVQEPIHGTAYRMHLIVSQDLPEEIVYRITKTLAENLGRYEKITQSMAGISVKDMARKLSIPFHPGAIRYYKEMNVY
jgi:hypothetical protein